MGAVRLNISLLPMNNGKNPKGGINEQGKRHVMPRDKDKQTNKQTKKQHVQRHGYRRQYGITQLAESGMQCIRVHSKASELIRDVWSLVHKVCTLIFSCNHILYECCKYL